jgi:hypothetical protein
MQSGSCLAAIAGLFFAACGGDSSDTAPAADAAMICDQKAAPGDGGACLPELPSCWTPTWRPPKSPVQACTDAQILEDLKRCHGDTFDPNCAVFERDPANSVCLGCILSTFDEPTYGAVIVMSNNSFLSNIPGCMALLDGDSSDTGCGAKYQAYEQCTDAACASQCSTYEAYSACWDAAGTSLCTPEREDAVCRLRPSYNICRRYNTFQEYFFAMAKIFCASGFDGGTAIDP